MKAKAWAERASSAPHKGIYFPEKTLGFRVQGLGLFKNSPP